MSQMLSDFIRRQAGQKKKLEKFIRAFNDVEVTESTRESNRAAAQKMLAATYLSEEFLAQTNKEAQE